MSADIRAAHAAGIVVGKGFRAHVLVERQKTTHFVIGCNPLVGDLRDVGRAVGGNSGQKRGVDRIVVALGHFHSNPGVFLMEGVEHGVESVSCRGFRSAPAEELQRYGLMLVRGSFFCLRRLRRFCLGSGRVGFLGICSRLCSTRCKGEKHGECEEQSNHFFHFLFSFQFIEPRPFYETRTLFLIPFCFIFVSNFQYKRYGVLVTPVYHRLICFVIIMYSKFSSYFL